MRLALQIGAALLVPGACLVVACVWLRRRWIRRAAERADALITPLTKDRYRFPKADDSVRIRTEQRRKAADGIRKRAAKVETGASGRDVLRAVV